MPYIAQEQRPEFDEYLDHMPIPENKGELEYCIFKLMQRYKAHQDYNYKNLHDIAYAAIHCGDEFRRRFLDHREEMARSLNGDVF